MDKNKIKQHSKHFGLIYRQAGLNFQNFQLSFEDTIGKLNKVKPEYYISGDFNIDLLKSVNNQNIKTYYDSLISLGCIPIIRHPTRITPTSATLLDHIYANNVTQPCTAHILLGRHIRPSA